MNKEDLKRIENVLTGYTQKDFEHIFERVVIPLYIFQAKTPLKDTEYKIINRLTNKDVTL